MTSQQIRAIAPEQDPLRMGMGWTVDDLSKPQIMVESTFGDSHPGSAHLLELVEQAVIGVKEHGGKAARYFTTDICDGMAQGHDGINYSLASRDTICNMIEIHAGATPFDGGVFVASCDKGMPAHLMGIGRVNIPSIVITGGVMDAKEVGHPGELKMNLEQTKAVCDRAHTLGLKVASHTESEEGLDIALRGGVDTIEHGAAIDDEMLALYRKNHSAMVVTFSPCVPLSILPPEITRLDDKATVNTRVVGQGMADGANRALKEDIPLGLGTDAACPLCTQYNTWRELLYVSRFCGVSPAKAICIATLENAKIAGIEKETGSIAEGKAADLLIVRKNPLENLRALRDPEYVFAKGKQFSHPKQKKIEKIEQWLDSIDFEQLTFSGGKSGGN